MGHRVLMNHLQLAKKKHGQNRQASLHTSNGQQTLAVHLAHWLGRLKTTANHGEPSGLVIAFFFPPDSLPNHWIGCTEELPMANQRNTRGSPSHMCQDAVMAASSVQVVIRVIEHVGEAPLLTLISYIFIKRRILQQ